MKQEIKSLERLIKNPKQGLGYELFLFVSRLTPMINVDLLIKNSKEQVLLTWREDEFYGAGWHIPGGIIRYKETLGERIRAVAKTELGARVKYKKEPLAIKEIIAPRKDRGHFISLLYDCRLISAPVKRLQYQSGTPKRGQWFWHDPNLINVLPVHKMIYSDFLNKDNKKYAKSK